MNQWYLGTIGFSYKEWVGLFYPPGAIQRDYLPYYSKVFNSVEIDTTFHSLPRSSTVQSWKTTVPPAFKFCLKTPRVVTHEHGLFHSESLMAEFIDTLEPLREKMGPILIQLPPNFRQDNISILRDFIGSLPPLYRYAIEFRHPSWYNDKTAQLLTQHNICWVAIDFPNISRQIIKTTDFLYIRWIGINGMYHQHSYERVDKISQLKWWLNAIQNVSGEVSTIYGFFNNDYTGFAAGTSKRFMIMVA